MAKRRMAEEQSATFVVNLPELGFKGHVTRIVRLLETFGYRAVPMSGELILQFADQIRDELADAQTAERIITQAARHTRGA